MKRFPLLVSIAPAVVWLLPVVGPFATPARTSIITTGHVNPGRAGTQPDPWSVGGDLKVGDSGIGTLDVSAGGVVSNSHGYIGYWTGSTGEVTVTGAGSQWNNSGLLSVGRSGNGTPNVEEGGVVSNDWDHIGRHVGSTGEATVTGMNSQWNNSITLYVGTYGSDTLNVEGCCCSDIYAWLGPDLKINHDG